MINKGYLKSGDGITALSADTTTIGKENCDIIVDDSCIDLQHAVIQHSHDEDCFVLHDLNSAEGTYVNNCRVQNSAVRLAPGDIIKFGHSGTLYELLVDSNSKTYHSLPVQQRPSWNSPIQILVSSPRNENNDTGTFPMINVLSAKPSLNASQTKASSIQPHPPLHLRSRSAEPFQRTSNMSSIAFPEAGDTTRLPMNSADMTANILLREKDNKIIQMGDEISRLAIYEQESKRKDNLVTSLRDEVAHLHERISSDHQLSSTQVYQKLQGLEKELSLRRNEVTLLRDQLNCVNRNLGVSPTLTTKLTDSEKKVRDLSQELEKARKECAMSQGLVQSLQREISTQESSYQKAFAELTLLRKENKKKEIQLSSISSKYTKLNEDKSKDDVIDNLRREVKDTKIKLSVADKRTADQMRLLQTYKDEVSKFQSKHQNALDNANVASKQLEEFKQKYYEMQRTERMLKVDMEQCRSRLDRFRVRVLNIVYSCPGMRIPDDIMAVDDSAVADDLKKIIKKKMEIKEKLESTEEKLHEKEAKFKDYLCSSDTCKNEIQNMLSRVSKSGHLTHVLKNESELLTTLAVNDDGLNWIYKTIASYLDDEMNWSATLDKALTRAGYDVTIGEKHPSEHVSDLHQNLQSEKYSHQQTRDLYKELEVRHQEELQSNVEKLLRENEEKLTAQIESVRLEEEEKFQKSLEELHEKEKTKRLKALDEEREKIATANLGIEQLRKLLAEKQEEEDNLRKKLQMAFEENEKQKTVEKRLRDEMNELERDMEVKKVSSSQHFDDVRKEYEADIKQHKEEVHQHSITIVSMEEKIRSLVNEKQDYENQMKKLRNRMKEMENRSRTPPPPVQPVSTVQSDQEITFLKTELFHAGQEIGTLKNTILGLRRDLSGSQARLSDMTGELSESQKLELERNRSKCKEQDLELNALRQKLLKLSTIVDSQKVKIETLTIDLKKQVSAIKQREVETNERVDDIKHLEAQLENERSKLVEKGQVEVKKGKIAEELSSLGAQCRGERHDEIISRQCEALAELRARVKALEQIRPPLPSQEQALQQVILLKKELAEIRAKQAMEEDKHFQAQLSLGRESLDNQNQLRTVTTQASIERTAREELEASLNFAERCYMDLLNTLSSTLGISNLNASGTMLHLPADEREKLMTLRKKDLDKVCSNVKSTLQQLDRKEQLLQGYENDLIKLREAEHFASNKSHRVESLSQQLAEKAEETEHLREALNQSNEQLELEKRLNNSIKQRKTFYLENLDYRRPPPQAKSTYQSEFDLMKKKTSKAKQNNKIKRKQYEIDVLKQRVYGKERDLCTTTARLVNQVSAANDEVIDIHKMREQKRQDDLCRDT